MTATLEEKEKLIQPETTPHVEEHHGNKLTRNTKHPVAVVVFVAFKLFPLVFGLVDIFVSISQVGTYISYALGIAMDFYNTKNYAGRFLGKMRWHTYVVDKRQYYYFESLPVHEQSKFDKWVFWGGLWLGVIYYAALILTYFVTLKFTSLPIVIAGFMAGLVNLQGYIRCSQDAAKKNASNFASKMMYKAFDTVLNSDQGKKIVADTVSGMVKNSIQMQGKM